MKKLAWMVPAMAGLMVAAGCNTNKGPKNRPVAQEPARIETAQPVGTWETQPTTAGVAKREFVPAKEKPVPAVAQTTPYTVARGDTLTGIAAQYGLRWQDILAVNPGLNPNLLRVNQTIYLPGVVDVSAKRDIQPRVAAPVPAGIASDHRPAAASDNVYVVKSGDTLSHIAQRHGVKVAELKAANGLKSDVIRVNQKLALPAGAKKDGAAVTPPAPPRALTPPPVVPPKPPVVEAVVAPAPVPAPPPAVVETAVPAPPAAPAVDAAALRTHTVQEKEDIFTIALNYGVTPTELRELNKINVNNLVPGTELQIPPPAMPAP